MKTKVLVIIPLDLSQKNKLSQFEKYIDFEFASDCNINHDQISNSKIIIGNPPLELLEHAEKLKWIQLITAGADAYLKDNILKDSVIVTNASGAYGEAQSEFMLALTLSLYKKLNIYRDNQNNCLWNDEGNEKMLQDATVLILGMGDIGTQYAKMLKAFGVHIIGVRRSINKNNKYADEMYSFNDLAKIIHRADIVSMSLPSSPETINIMDKEMISRIKQDAVLINVGRGNTLDINALCEAIENNKISGAALDVFENEPLPRNHKIWNTKNIIITPHIAGHDFLPHTLNKTLSIIEQNIKAYIEGKQLINIVDRNIYEFKY